MTPNEYQTQAERTDAERTQQVVEKLHRMKPVGVRLLHAMIGIQTESGEFADSIKKWLFYNQVLDRTNLKEELGDLLWYIAQACSALEVDMEEVMQANIAKLQKRFPEKYDDRLAAEQNRDREGERCIIEEVAKPPETLVEKDIPPVVHARFGDGLEREASNSGYTMFCATAGCNRPIHRTNTAGVCPDCYAKMKQVGGH